MAEAAAVVCEEGEVEVWFVRLVRLQLVVVW